MKNVFSACVVSLFVVAAGSPLSSSQDRAETEGIRGRFVGAWRLISLETEIDAKRHRVDSTGLLVFTRDRHMSVQVMELRPQPQALTGPAQYSQGGYEASFGTYEVDESAHTFTFHVEGALVRTLIGKDLPRAFEFSGKHLTVTSARAGEHWRVIWERY